MYNKGQEYIRWIKYILGTLGNWKGKYHMYIHKYLLRGKEEG